ncbi:MAG: hypothetical protein QXY62_03395 [Candidatus Altiarchaeota archaeon]
MEHNLKQNCSECKKFGAIVKINYMKKSLCRNCFSKFFEGKVSKTIRKENLLKKDDKLAILVSGNVSSMVLLKVLHKLSKRAPKSKLTAILISEKNNNSENISKKFCKELNVEFEQSEKNFYEILSKEKFDKIALPYNLDDQVKNAMLKFIDGDYEGIVKINENQKIIMPLKNCLYDEILTYAKINKIPFDEEKLKSDDAVEKILDKIQKKNPGVKFQILRSIESLRNVFRKNLK